MDIWSSEKRSIVMSHIKSKNTKPEMIVRSLLFKMGYRFRIHRNDLPGSPDIVLPKYSTVILVHGCFWHLHKDCRDGTIPKTQYSKWKEKLERNVQRDKINIDKLNSLGWEVLILWECEIEKHIEDVKDKLRNTLEKNSY